VAKGHGQKEQLRRGMVSFIASGEGSFRLGAGQGIEGEGKGHAAKAVARKLIQQNHPSEPFARGAFRPAFDGCCGLQRREEGASEPGVLSFAGAKPTPSDLGRGKAGGRWPKPEG
jgi:hypothetical protein